MLYQKKDFVLWQKEKPMNDLIEKLSDLRSQVNCFDENERDAYNTLSEAIKVLSERPEPCEDAVNRQAVIDTARKVHDIFEGEYDTRTPYGVILDVQDAVSKLPSVAPKQDPCEDAVNRADMLETYADLYDVFEDNDQIRKELNKVYDKLNALPSVTPKRKTGKWIHSDFSHEFLQCSECGRGRYFCSNFCPNCGADMRCETE